MIVGIDVSSYQSETFPTSGLAFCIVKATESTTYINPKYRAQLAHARSAGLIAGHYHYARGTDSDAEVAYFAAHADVQAGDVIALDWEQTEVTAAARDEWLRAAKARFPHNKVILYCNVDYWTSRDSEHYAADGLWIADYSAAPGKPRVSPWVFHQYSSANGMDHSVANFTSKAALATWANALNAPAAKPTIEDEEIMAKSESGTAFVSWAAGARSVIQVNAQGKPDLVLDIELKFETGPWYTESTGNGGPFTVRNGSDVWRVPAALVSKCRGAILTWHKGSAAVEYDVFAGV